MEETILMPKPCIVIGKHNSGVGFNLVKQNNVQGDYFLRGRGKKVQVMGAFRHFGNTVTNHGKPFSLNVDDLKGKSYEFMSQHLSIRPNSSATNILGQSLIFIIEPDNNG